MMSKKDEHIDYSNLPDDLVAKPKHFDMSPEPGQDGREFDRLFQPGSTFKSAEELSEQFRMAVEKDSNVFIEVMDLLDALQGWVTRKAIDARSGLTPLSRTHLKRPIMAVEERHAKKMTACFPPNGGLWGQAGYLASIDCIGLVHK